ncbi:GntR family transcriptional regulator [Rhodopseudomonas sp. P2A-2r]|uniref:GntR family transcriptional regulator n=1 Tax=unclassified Rhodopseudomonas TaxID=2638247 RepID=UPI0022340659|nr:GntR family transcriptional regulator [Rhodopseudomonas sp. P2A-2r]UZE49725.1 GntR family transcriptional regulator [Rhodopseudomonas sp. P2A-2r]
MSAAKKASSRGSKAAPEPRPRAAGNITEATYKQLQDLIETRQLVPGEVIEERRLALRLKVSRTPLRAGISRLLGEGKLEQLSNGSVVVRNIGITELLELIHLRIVLESEAASIAATRIALDTLQPLKARLEQIMSTAKITKSMHWNLDDEIHDLIASNCGNRSLERLIGETRLKSRLCNVERRPERLLPACREHLAIVDAIIQRDAQGARQAMVQHLVNVRQGMLETFGIFLPAGHA